MPRELWGDLQPADLDAVGNPLPALPADRDSTNFKEFRDKFHETQWWMSLDIENGWIFVGGGHNVEVWDARSSPTRPVRTAQTAFTELLFDSGEEFTGWPARDIDLPQGVDTVGAQVGKAGLGLAIYDFSARNDPQVIYQQRGGLAGLEVYAATINGRHYAFGAMDVNGLRVYDMTQALSFGRRCTDNLQGTICGGVYKGRVGTRRPTYVDGAGNFVVVSFGTGRGFEIWDMGRLPALPSQPALTGLTDQNLWGVALWKEGASYYLGVAGFDLGFIEGRIYDVSCLPTSCSSLGAPLWRQRLNRFGVDRNFVTFSRSDGTPFLFFGNEDRLSGGPQREFLFDVTNPRAPLDITPSQTAILRGAETSYWSWYYQGNPTGFDNVGPRRGKFHGAFFYRAGWSIFDIHQRTGGFPPRADFTWSSTAPDGNVYPEVAVNFSDASAGSPVGWSWTFPAGTTICPAGVSVAGCSRTGEAVTVLFDSPGEKSVTLFAANDAGDDLITKMVPVLDPVPRVGSVTSDIQQIQQCQPITFTANDVTGRPVLAYSWRVLDAGDLAVAGPAPDDATYLWATGPGTLPGTYRGEVTVSGPGGSSGAVVSSPVSVVALAQLPASGSFAPTIVTQEDPVVNFQVQASGATEWNWDFGDGTTTGWISDPVAGPAATHTYTEIGSYQVTVQVRNCVGSPVQSAVLPVTIESIAVVTGFFRPNPFIGCNFVTNTCMWETGLPLPFLDQSSDAVTRWEYDWDGNGTFEDNNNGVGYPSPRTSHTYSQAGTFIPRLRVSNGPQSYIFPDDNPDHDGFEIEVTTAAPPTPPTITISGSTSGTVGQSLSFRATASNCTPSFSGWRWTATDLVVSDTSPNVTLNWSMAGAKTVTVTNTNCGSARGSLRVSITDPGTGGNLQARINFSPPNPAVGQSVSFSAASSLGSPTDYLWTFGDRTDGQGVTVQHAYSEAGSYEVELTVTKPGDGPGCFGGFCFDVTQKTVTVGVGGTLPTITVTGPAVGDTGQGLTFTATATNCTANSNGWNWSTSGGSLAPPTNSGDQSQAAITWSSPGTKTVTVTNSGCGGAEGGRSVTINRPSADLEAIFSFSPESPGVHETVSFDASSSSGDPTLYDWDFGDGGREGSSDPHSEHAYGRAGDFTVILTVTRPGTGAGCFNGFCFDVAEDTVTVGGAPRPMIQVSGPSTGGAGQDLIFNATAENCAPSADGWSWTASGGGVVSADGPEVSINWSTSGAKTVTATNGTCGDARGSFEIVITGCGGDPLAICLGDGRFKVSVDWTNPRLEPEDPDMSGFGNPLPVNPLPGQNTSGFFWFFNPNSTDLIVKLIDGRGVNNAFWFFYGALTDVEYTIEVEDLETGASRSFHNDPFNICGDADIEAFPQGDNVIEGGGEVPPVGAALASFAPGAPVPPVDLASVLGRSEESTGDCQSGPHTLCLLDGRFEVEVDFTNQRAATADERAGVGTMVPGTNETGYFWFFEPSTLDLVIKMIDGTEVNGKYWFFYGALTDVEYTIRVTDTQTAVTREYFNPANEICGDADIEAFE